MNVPVNLNLVSSTWAQASLSPAPLLPGSGASSTFDCKEEAREASTLGTGHHELHHEGAKSFNKLGELHMGPSQSLVQLRSFLDLEFPQPWTAKKRPPGASALGTGRHEVHHEGVKSFNKLGELHMGPSQSPAQL